jgi:hypothetical protein
MFWRVKKVVDEWNKIIISAQQLTARNPTFMIVTLLAAAAYKENIYLFKNSFKAHFSAFFQKEKKVKP